MLGVLRGVYGAPLHFLLGCDGTNLGVEDLLARVGREK
jgi:hypothetical protein